MGVVSSSSTGFRCSVWTRPNWANLRAWQRGSAGDPRALCQIAEGNPACGDSCHLDPGASRIRLRIPSTPEGARLVRSQNVSPASFFGSPLCFCFYLPGLHFHGPVCSQVLGLLVLFSVFFFFTAFTLPFSALHGCPNFGPTVFVLFFSLFTWQIIEAANLGTSWGK